jgi:PGF-pre-PGF domain-containing protein
MSWISQDANASFYLPLINATGVKEMNIYSMDYAPKRVGVRTPAQILANNNITLSEFDPDAIDSALAASSIVMELYTSSSTCDVPNPISSCAIGSSTDMENFKPLAAMIGGGKVSFRMGTGGILIHYANVDMMASGPPDALFEDSTAEDTVGNFDSALKFGSLGPTIYDYVLVSIPYTQGGGASTGLNEDSTVNVSIPLFYDENSSGVMDWNTPIWNTGTNGTTGSNLAGNYTHFSTYSSDWETLMGNNTCITNVNNFNATNPCYIDKTNNRIWIRLPHFSGTRPSILGTVAAASTSNGGTNGGGGSSGTDVPPVRSYSFTQISPGAAAIMKDFDSEIGVKQIQIEVKNQVQNVKITVTKHSSKPADVSVEKSGKVNKYLQIEAENLEDNMSRAILTLQVRKSWLSDNDLGSGGIALFRFNENSKIWEELVTTHIGAEGDNELYNVELTSFSYFAVAERVLGEGAAEGAAEEGGLEDIAEKIKSGVLWPWVLIIVIIIVVLVALKVKKK